MITAVDTNIILDVLIRGSPYANPQRRFQWRDKMSGKRKEEKTNPRLRAAFLEVVDNQLRDNNPPETRRHWSA